MFKTCCILSALYVLGVLNLAGCRHNLQKNSDLLAASNDELCAQLDAQVFTLESAGATTVEAGQMFKLNMNLHFSGEFSISDRSLLELIAVVTRDNSPESASLRLSCQAEKKAADWNCLAAQAIPPNFGGNYKISLSTMVRGSGRPDASPVFCTASSPVKASLTVQNTEDKIDVDGPLISRVEFEETTACSSSSIHWKIIAKDSSGINTRFIDGHITLPGQSNYLGYPDPQLESLGDDTYRVTFPLRGIAAGKYQLQFVQLKDTFGNFKIFRPQDNDTLTEIEIVPCAR